MYVDISTMRSPHRSLRFFASQVLSVIAQQLLQLFSAKRELTSYNDAWRGAWDGSFFEKIAWNTWIYKAYIYIYIYIYAAYQGISMIIYVVICS